MRRSRTKKSIACFDAVVAGHTCLDIIPTLSGPLPAGPGLLVEIGPAELATGGAVANTGVALHILGIRTRLMGKVSDDLFGQALLQVIGRYSAELVQDMVLARGEASSYTIVIDPPGLDRSFMHCPGLNHTFGAADVDYEVVAQARLFHFGYPSLMRRMYADGGHELSEMLHRAKATGATTTLDFGPPDPQGPCGQVDWDAVLARTLPHVDVFLPSDDELRFALDRPRFDADGEVPVPEVRALGRRVLALGAKVVGIKCGVRGLYVCTANADRLAAMGRAAPADPSAWAERELWSPCFVPRELVGTTGAGDATIAGFLAALLRGLSLEEAATFACTVGACNVEASDAVSGLRSWEATWERCDGWARMSFEPEGDDWRLDAASGLWMGGCDEER
jgi:sugar/nucleoside kinase (ribokinase family)